MSCGCGKKKCNGKCGISPSVLQINNNDCTLFHKVEVPAVMGDETTNPPKTGAYRNVLLYYEASGNSYLYSSDGIPTKLTGVVSDYEVLTNKPSINGVVLIKNKTLADLGIISAIDSAVADEATARENADNALSDRITTNANNIAANATAISNEATARANADNTLSARISGNTTAINNEKTARENADTALSNRITANANAISTETTARENADNALSGRITANANAISDEKTARENADAGLQDQITAVKATADSAVQPDDIDKTVMSDLAVDSNSSTAQVILKESKVNLKTGATSSEQTSLPVASSSQAGVMNSATYDAVTSNTSNINAIMNGAVAITGLPANPSQSDLTTAWQNETGLSTLINRASVYDVTNNKVWTYYTNDTTWHVASNTSQVTVNTFTNSSEGTIKGSTSVGQVFAENDGTGSVNGWDALSDAVSNNTSKLAGIESGAEVNVQSDWNVSDSSSDAYIKNKPTIGNGTLTIQKNGATIDTFTANSTTNKTVNITVPTVNDATLTIQKNGDTVQTFTANSSSNKTANIEVPTKTSELDNDAGFIANDTHQVCGEGGDITLDTTTFEPLEMNHLGGNTEQQTYTGKNLLKLTNGTYSKNGVTAVVDNGVITLSGTASAVTYIVLTASPDQYTLNLQGDYKLVTQAASGIYNVVYYDENSTMFNSTGSQVKSLSGEYTRIRFQLYIPNGTNTNGIKISPMIIVNGTDESFEPFVGGAIAPSPDYPQAVQTVTGENVVRICGKNLLKPYDQSGTISVSGLAATLHDDGSISINGTSTAETYIEFGYQFYGATSRQSVPIYSLDPSLTYNLSSTYTGSITGGAYPPRLYAQYNGELQEVSAPFGSSVNISGSNGIYRSWMRIRSGTSFDNVTFYPQLEIGSTATEYQPYQSQSYEVNLGKNLFDGENANAKTGYILNDSGVEVSDNTGGYTRNYSAVRPNTTYTISGMAGAGTRRIYFYDGDKTFLSRTSGYSGAQKITFTTPANCYFVNVQIYTNTDNATAMVSWQLELGSTATSYAAYFEPIELCKLGNAQDSIYKSDNKWYVRKEVGKYQLDGTEVWGTATDGYIIAANSQSPFYNILATGTPSYESLCSHFYFQPNATTWTGDGKCGFNPTGTFWVMYAAPADKNAFLAWLGQTKPSIYFPLATPTDTEITNEALVAQLEALWEADGYDNQTNIALTYAEGNAQGILSVCQYPSHLPVATKSKLGTIIVGHGLDIEDDGRLDVIVDSALSDSSIHPVQNKVITTELNNKADISSVPTKTSQLENDSGFVVNDTTEICDEGSDITLNGTLLEPLDVKKVEGATSQQTYTGKNLYPLIPSTTNNGITFTQNADGTYNITGTSTAQANASFWLYDISGFESGQTYTISVSPTPTNLAAIVEVYNGDTWVRNGNTATAWIQTQSKVLDLTGANRLKFTFRAEPNQAVNLQNFKVQFEKGSSATAWEKYVGGTPAPNPDYPQAVKTVTGENVVRINGKNLLKLSQQATTSNGITATLDNGIITYSGTASSNWANIATRTYNSIPAGTYTLSMQETFTTNYAYALSVTYTDNTTATFECWQSVGNKRTVTFAKDVASSYIYLIGLTSNTSYSGTISLMLESGSTATTPFEPYQEQSYEVNLGKNLFDVSSITENTAAATNGTENHEVTYSTSTNRAIMLIKVEPNSKYTLSIGDTNIVNRIYCAGMKTTTLESGHSFSWVNSGTTITTTSKDNYILGVLSISSGQGTIANVTNANVQFEKGSQATSYAAYFEPIELCKIRDYQDYIYKSGGKWYVHKEVGKHIFDGSETFTADSSYSGIYQYRWTDSSVISISDQDTICALSDKFYGRPYRNSWEYDFSVVPRLNANALRFMTSLSTTYSAFQTWLASNPTTVYYALATTTDTEITNETLVAQLNALADADGYEGQTNIFTVSDGVDERAVLSVCQYPSHLPIATKTKLGTVVVGHGLDIEADGKLDVIVDDDFSTESDHPVQNKVITNALAGKADNTDLSTVAMTGSYDDLTGKPTIPTVNNATLTIQKNGTNVATFTANSSTNVTANITAPVVTMTTTDPGEGGALAANNFIGVYV